MAHGGYNIKQVPIAKTSFGGEEAALVLDALRSGWIAQGKFVEKFEDLVAGYTGARHAVAVSSGTAALHLAMVVAGVGRGDEVLVPSFSFIATANSVAYTGAKPVFLDIDPDTYNIDPRSITDFIERHCRSGAKKTGLYNRKTGARIKAVMPVHQFGLPCDIDKIKRIAEEHGLGLIEDAACALGASYKGRMIGHSSRLACFSFHPRKILTTGEGGMIVTDDAGYYRKLRALRNHGMAVGAAEKHKKKTLPAEGYEMLGYNYRMTDIQAAIGTAQMSKLPEMIRKRRLIAEYYTRAFCDMDNLSVPYIPGYAQTNCQSYILRLKKFSRVMRDNLIEELLQDGIHTRRGNTAIHQQALYRNWSVRLPNTEEAAHSTIALPIYACMTRREQEFVVDRLLARMKRYL